MTGDVTGYLGAHNEALDVGKRKKPHVDEQYRALRISPCINGSSHTSKRIDIMTNESEINAETCQGITETLAYTFPS